ncbi:MAG TPA: cyclopropane-fatty-acyl-phospholipid synthase family protein [Beijerinckiaceae bacterium]|jgi:cyclopropane-fatty-acyl-phospholipid synthase|nr:cyclopropane-fatty-acyl-phospholipid synthase family protein [Beijerinckiaceae bacterium]
MNTLLQRTLERVIRNGNLLITDPDGKVNTFGDGNGPPAHIVIHTSHAEWAITRDPMLAFPESYMSGEVDFLEGDVLRLLSIVYKNVGLSVHGNVLTRIIEGTRNLFKRLQQLNTTNRAKENVHRHYDLSGELYKLFLDEDMQYSCAYFERPDMTLEEAQLAKKRHLAAKLLIKPGQRVLDIGSGWGGLGLYLARQCEADVLGITLSTEQHGVAEERARAAGLDKRVRFELTDYRDLTEPFDRIVSVGMFEHVGVNHFRTFFEQSAKLLKKDGIMVLHSIGRNGPPIATGAFIRKYIFPGGYIPSLSEVLPVIESAGLMVNDIEILRFHYADTLKAWQERFQAHRDRAKEIYDERFCRMWEFYLAASEAAFRWQELMVFQIQLTHRNDVVPLTRGYIDQFVPSRSAVPSRAPAAVNSP